MDKGKLVRLVLIPIIIGLVVTLIVRQVLAPSQSTVTNGQQVEMTSVVAIQSKDPIPVHTKLTEQNLVLKQVPKSILTGSEFTAVKDVAGQVTNVALEPGEIVLKSRVVPEGKGTLAYRIPAGMRAITIRIDELTGVAGNPQPGDLVDLILVLQEKKPDRPAATSRMIYEAVPVLAKGPAAADGAGSSGKDGAAVTGPADGPKLTSLTLAVKPDQAVEIALAEQIGLIKVTLRPAQAEGNKGNLQFSEQNYK